MTQSGQSQFHLTRPGMGGAVSGSSVPQKNTCDGRAGYH